MNNNNTVLPLSFSSIHLYGLYNYCYELIFFYARHHFKARLPSYQIIFKHLLFSEYRNQLKFLRIYIIRSHN